MQQSPRLWHQCQSLQRPQLLNQQPTQVEECQWRAAAYRRKAVKLWEEARALEERAEELAHQLSYQSGDKQVTYQSRNKTTATRPQQSCAVPGVHVRAATQLQEQQETPRTRLKNQQEANRSLLKDQVMTRLRSRRQAVRQRQKAKERQEELSKQEDKEAVVRGLQEARQQEARQIAAQQAQDRWMEAHHKATHGAHQALKRIHGARQQEAPQQTLGARQQEAPQQTLGARQQEALQEFHRVVAEVEVAVALLHLDQLLH